MSSLIPARRRAERFDDAVEGSTSGRSAGVDPELSSLLELVGALRETSLPSARPAFVADLRSSLLAAAETELAPAAGTTRVPATRAVTPTTTSTGPTRGDRRFAVALGGLALVGATTSMAVAAQSALPGDVLYPVKRAMEDADTSLSAKDERGTQLLDHASGRLDELDQLSTSAWNGARTAAAEDALTTFTDQASEASGLLVIDFESDDGEQSITELRDFTGQSIEQLSGLTTQLPAELRPALVDAAEVLVGIDQQAAELCPACGTGILDLPVTLTSALPPADGSDELDDQGSVTTADAEAPTGQLGATPATPRATPEKKVVKPVLPSVPPLTEVPVVKPTAPVATTTPGSKKKVDGTVPGVTGLVNGVVGELTGSTVTPSPTLPDAGQVVDGTLGTIDKLTGQLLAP